jgi:hypothetical protein
MQSLLERKKKKVCLSSNVFCVVIMNEMLKRCAGYMHLLPKEDDDDPQDALITSNHSIILDQVVSSL